MNNKTVFVAIKITICLFFMFIILTSCGLGGRFYDREPSRPPIYIALGDSVSSGYGLLGYQGISLYSHPSLFFELLMGLGYVEEYRNMAVSGFTTTNLLELLYSLDDDTVDYFRNARIISINIGGNNLLTPFQEYVFNMEVVDGIEQIRGGWSVVLEAVSGDDASDVTIPWRIFDGLRGGIRILLGGVEVLLGSPEAVALLWGSLSYELEMALNSGVQLFENEFDEIITWLQYHSPNATIIVNTIHNPIPQDVLGANLALSDWANELITTMNIVITDRSQSRGFMVADAHALLSNRLDLTDFNINPFTGQTNFDIVHPNAYGHVRIAEMHYNLFRGIMTAY